jgi:hypothetical protein
MMTYRCVRLIALGLTLTACSRSSDSHVPDTGDAAVAIADSAGSGDSMRRPSPMLVSAADLAAAACDYSPATDSVGKAEYAPVLGFLRVLHSDAAANPDSRQDVTFVSLDRLLSFVSDSGLSYVNVNTVGDLAGSLEGETTTTNSDTIIHVPLDSLRALLRAERGSLYENFEGLAKQYGASSSGYSDIRFCSTSDGVVALIGMQFYSLAFRRQGSGLRLTRFAALEVAAD